MLEKIQRKTTNITGPLLVCGKKLEDARNSMKECVQLLIPYLLDYAEKTILLLCQSSNVITERYSVLSSIPQQSFSSKMLREVTLLQRHVGDGEKFHSHITETTKSKIHVMCFLIYVQ